MQTSPKEAAERLLSDLHQLRLSSSQEARASCLIANASLIHFFLINIRKQFTEDELWEIGSKHNLSRQGVSFAFSDKFTEMEEWLDTAKVPEVKDVFVRMNLGLVEDYDLENLERAMQYVQFCTFSEEKVE